MDVKFTNRRCDYCGVFEGMGHSPDCGIGKMATAIAQKSQELKEDMAHLPLHIVTTLTPETEQYKHEIGRFVEAMVHKLTVHAKKGKWSNYDIHEALEKLGGEVDELGAAIKRGNMVEILLEAADVGNYALIISAKAMER